MIHLAREKDKASETGRDVLLTDAAVEVLQSLPRLKRGGVSSSTVAAARGIWSTSSITSEQSALARAKLRGGFSRTPRPAAQLCSDRHCGRHLEFLRHRQAARAQELGAHHRALRASRERNSARRNRQGGLGRLS